MNRSARYSKITSIDQLRNERMKLESEIANREMMLSMRCKNLINYFSIANLLSVAISRINSFNTIVTWIESAYKFVRSIIKGKNKQQDTEQEPVAEQPEQSKKRTSTVKQQKQSKNRQTKKVQAKGETKKKQTKKSSFTK